MQQTIEMGPYCTLSTYVLIKLLLLISQKTVKNGDTGTGKPNWYTKPRRRRSTEEKTRRR